MKLIPRYYQAECVEAIDKGPKACIAVIGTGGGKSFIMSQIPRQGRVLVLVHREDLMYSNAENFNCSVGFEKAEKTSNGEECVIASIQSLMNRLDKFDPKAFDLIVVDEVHHIIAPAFRKVVDHFEPRKLVGLTATPERSDGVGLDSLFDKIVYTKDLKELIEEGYLSPVKCFKVDVGYDISGVMSRVGDFAIAELERQVNVEGSHQAIKDIIAKYDGSSIVACVNVQHAEDVAKAVGGVAVTADTPNRMEIIQKYKSGEIHTLTTVNVLSEGSNLPIAKNLIMAAPTQSKVKYIQLAGRVMRLHESKKECRIFDLVGNLGKHTIAGPHTLLGMDVEAVPESQRVELIGDLINELPTLIKKKSDCPESWIKNIKAVELFARKSKLKTHSVNYFKHPDGSMIVSLANGKWIGITSIDHLNESRIITSNGKHYEKAKTQENFDTILLLLKKHAKKESPLWNSKSVKRWGKEKASAKQRNYANALLRKHDISFYIDNSYSKQDVACILNRLNKDGLQTNKQKRSRNNQTYEIRFEPKRSI